MALTSDKGGQMLASCFLDPPIDCQGKGSVTFMPAFQPAQEFWGGTALYRKSDPLVHVNHVEGQNLSFLYCGKLQTSSLEISAQYSYLINWTTLTDY